MNKVTIDESIYTPDIMLFKDNCSYESIEFKEFPSIDKKSVHIHNYQYNNIDRDTRITISGRVFLASTSTLYYHALTDVLGQYELLRSVYTDLQIIFVHKDGMLNYNDLTRNGSLYHLNIQKIYNSDNLIFNLESNNYTFEEVIMFPNPMMRSRDEFVPFQLQYLGDTSVEEYKNTFNYFYIRTEGLKKLKERFHYLDDKRPKKIYCARNSVLDESVAATTRSTISRDEELRLFEYFKNQGYEIINFNGYLLEDQIAMFSSATHIAGVKGSNMFNSIWAAPGTTVVNIHVDSSWNYPFEEYFRRLGLNSIQVADNRIVDLEASEDKMSIIIEELNKLDCL